MQSRTTTCPLAPVDLLEAGATHAVALPRVREAALDTVGEAGRPLGEEAAVLQQVEVAVELEGELEEGLEAPEEACEEDEALPRTELDTFIPRGRINAFH